MLKYFIEGGSLFMGMLSIVLLIVLVLTVVNGRAIITGKNYKGVSSITYIKSLGLFGLVLGMLGQFIGMFQAFKIIGSGMEISPSILASGLKVSSITNIYGMIIFLISYILWFMLSTLVARKTEIASKEMI